MITSDSKIDFDLRKRLDELARGECSEDDFLQDVLIQPRSTPDAAWDVLAHVDQQYRRGHLSDDLFRSIETKIARHALKDAGYGRTVDLPSHVTERDEAGDKSVPLHAGAPPAAGSVPKTIDLRKTSDAEVTAAPARIGEDWCGRVFANRYVIEGVLGDGGMGRVFKALDRYRSELPESNRYVALKILHQKISEQPNLVSNLRREFFFAQSLAHQNIVNVYETDHDGDVAFFTMELLDGELLSEVIDRARPNALDRSYAFSIIRAIGAGLAHAHSRNMVHADLKPQNIMVTRCGEIRILDFGASRPSARRSHATTDFQSSVTPAYACCELLAGKPADPRDDLFALGCVSYELLTGRHPFNRKSSIQARDASLRPARPDRLSDRQWHSLLQALAWGRADRSLAVSEWVDRITTPVLKQPAQSPDRTATGSQGVWWKSAAAQRLAWWSSLLLIVTGLAVLAHRSRDRVAAVSATTLQPPKRAPRSVPATVLVPVPPAIAPMALAALQKPNRAPDLQPRPARRLAVTETAKTVDPPANSISVVAYRVSAGQGFAEVRVRRSTATGRDNGFVWWTVTGSALPGVDFVAQAPTSQIFSDGRRTSDLFIRLIPNARRTSARVFHVEIGKAASDDISAPIARTSIVIPAQP